MAATPERRYSSDTASLKRTESRQVKVDTGGASMGPGFTYSAVSAGPCRRWRGGAAAWTRRATCSLENTPPRRDTTSSGSDSCGCWCFSSPSRTNVSERSYLQLHTNQQLAGPAQMDSDYRTSKTRAGFKISGIMVSSLSLKHVCYEKSVT